jgi:hypothetical protein
MNLITLADRLGKTIAEIEEITVEELNEWLAWFKVSEERRKKDGRTKP